MEHPGSFGVICDRKVKGKMTTELVDTHTHLCDTVFDDDRQEVVKRAQQAGVGAIVLVAETLNDARRNLELAAEYPILKPAAGLYPAYADLGDADLVIELIRGCQDSLYAIGEVGLDFWIAKDDEGRELQREVFGQFIRLGIELDLPVNVHSRSAGRHAVAMLLENNAQRVQMHAFDGKASAALPAVEAGYFFSVPPSVVRSRQKQKLVRHLPMSCLLVESDSPVLGPDPETRNEPANILTAISTIAEIKNVSYDEVVLAVQENTSRLYDRF